MIKQIRAARKKKIKTPQVLRFPDQSGFGFCMIHNGKIMLATNTMAQPGEFLTVLERFDLVNELPRTEYVNRWQSSIVTAATRLYKLKPIGDTKRPPDRFNEAEQEYTTTGKISGYSVLKADLKVIWMSEYDYQLLLENQQFEEPTERESD